MMMMTVVRVCDDPRPVRTTIDRVFDAGRMRTHPRCVHLEVHTCLTAPAMDMQVMVDMACVCVR